MNTLNSSNLRKLQLFQLNMDRDSFGKFLEYVERCMLEELDLRDSRVTPEQFTQMLEVLKSNKHLKYLNLSHNNLVKQSASDMLSNTMMNFGNMLESIVEEITPSGAKKVSPRIGAPT